MYVQIDRWWQYWVSWSTSTHFDVQWLERTRLMLQGKYLYCFCDYPPLSLHSSLWPASCGALCLKSGSPPLSLSLLPGVGRIGQCWSQFMVRPSLWNWNTCSQFYFSSFNCRQLLTELWIYLENWCAEYDRGLEHEIQKKIWQVKECNHRRRLPWPSSQKCQRGDTSRPPNSITLKLNVTALKNCKMTKAGLAMCSLLQCHFKALETRKERMDALELASLADLWRMNPIIAPTWESPLSGDHPHSYHFECVYRLIDPLIMWQLLQCVAVGASALWTWYSSRFTYIPLVLQVGWERNDLYLTLGCDDWK